MRWSPSPVGELRTQEAEVTRIKSTERVAATILAGPAATLTTSTNRRKKWL
ncbi:MAG: hypothetical protein H7839_24155 [Magnetococcus sp. YQC-5]